MITCLVNLKKLFFKINTKKSTKKVIKFILNLSLTHCILIIFYRPSVKPTKLNFLALFVIQDSVNGEQIVVNNFG